VRIAKRVKQAIMMGKIEGSVMDSRTMIRDESEDNSEGGKPYLCGLAMSLIWLWNFDILHFVLESHLIL
jgi:hypothetical protein